MSHATFARPDLTTFARIDDLGLEVTGQRLEPDRAVLACRILEPDQWCRRCGCEGVPRDTVTRELAHEPLGWRPTTLLITVRRYRCSGCGHVWRQDGQDRIVRGVPRDPEPFGNPGHRQVLSHDGLECPPQPATRQLRAGLGRSAGGLRNTGIDTLPSARAENTAH